jgi:hypothetical protein
MKKNLLYGFLIAIILASLVTLPGVAREAPSNPAKAAANPTDARWFTGFADDHNTSARVGFHSSIAYSPIDGFPYISYYDSVKGNLMLASPATNGNCGDNNLWWCRSVDGDTSTTPPAAGTRTNGIVGEYSSIDFYKGTNSTNWKLGIAYYDATDNALKYAEWSPAYFHAGNNGWRFYIVDTAGSSQDTVGLYTSIKFNPSSGMPVIAYYKHVHITFPTTIWFGDMTLAYIASGGNCGASNSWQCTIVDAGLNAGVGQYASLGYAFDGVSYFVQMAYYDAVNADLKFAKSVGSGGNCGPSNSYQCDVIDSTDDVGISAALLAPQKSGQRSLIAYYDKTNGELKFARPWPGSDPNCGPGTTWLCDAVDTIGAGIINHVGISMARDKKGQAIIAYEDASDDLAPSYLKIARPAATSGNCGDVPPGNLFMFWQCDTLDGGYGGTYVNVAFYTSVAVSPLTGLATIAYLEDDSYGVGTNSLKVATQRLEVFLPLTVK